MNDIYHIEIPQEIDENDLPIQPEELNVELEGQNSASNRSQHDNTPGPPSVNREPSISKGPRRVAVDSREIVQLGISTVERLADQMVARYNQDAMLEEFMSNVESPGGLAAQKVPNSVAMDKLNPLLAKSNNQLPKVMTESTCRERRKKAIKSKLSTIKSLFCKEIISDIIYDNKEKDLKKLDTIPRSLFMLKGKAIMRHLFSFMDIEDKTNLLLAIKLKVLTNKDSNLLFLCLVKTALGFDLPQLLKVSAWHNYEGKMLREVISTNLDSDLLLRYISLFINLDQIDLKKPYEGWLALKYEKVNEINKDLTRTFPDFFNTEQRRELLKDVLVAIGNSCPNIGYVQGINAVTGAIMSYFVGHRIPDVINTNPALIQQLTFTIVKFMLERRSLTLMYERSLYGFTLLCLEIKLWIKVLHPDLYLYLVRVRLTKEESCFDYNLVLSRWVLNLFTTVYPVDFVMVVICQIMLEGLTAIIKLSIAMLGYWEHKVDHSYPS